MNTEQASFLVFAGKEGLAVVSDQSCFEATVTDGAMLPPTPPRPAIQAEPLGKCCKCGADATVALPDGKYVYCAECGRCGGKRVSETALGIEVRICGRSVETFVKHDGLGWVCSCMGYVR